MYSGAYSRGYQTLERQQMESLRELHREERAELVSRAKRLQQETIKRRKASAQKRKLEAQREEKRRQEILSKRREQQQEATEKFQRQNRTFRRPASAVVSSRSGTVPDLDDALNAVRDGRRVTSATYTRQTSANGRPSSAKDNQENVLNSSLNRAHFNQYGRHAIHTDKSNQVQQMAVRAELHNKSLRNLTNSKSLFEQQLENHQHQLIEQQRQSLHHFDAALKKELDRDKVEGSDDAKEVAQLQNDSFSSVDSLENLKSRAEAPVASAVAIASPLVRSTSSQGSNIAIVQPSVHKPSEPIYSAPSNHWTDNGMQNKYTRSENQNSFSSLGPSRDSAKPYNEYQYNEPYGLIKTGGNGRTNGHFYQDSVMNYVDHVEPDDWSSHFVQHDVPGEKPYIRSSYFPQENTQPPPETYKFQPHPPPSKNTQSRIPVTTLAHNTSVTSNLTPSVPMTEIKESKPVIETIHATQSQYISPTTVLSSNYGGAHAPEAHTSLLTQYAHHTAVGSYSNVMSSVRQQSTNQEQETLTAMPEGHSKSATINNYVSSFGDQPPSSALHVESYSDIPVDEASEQSDDTVDEKSETIEEPKKVKGILRKVSAYEGKPLTYSQSSSSLRDSLEVTKQHLRSKSEKRVTFELKKNKSVRFTDMTYEEEGDEREVFQPHPPASKRSSNRPSRPVSAKAASTTPAVESSVKPRAASAGTTRKAPSMNPRPPATNKPSSSYNHKNRVQGGANQFNNIQPSVRNEAEQQRPSVPPATDLVPEQNANNGIRTSSNLRLDKTPTDEEINYLWEKVRTCLSRTNSDAGVDPGVKPSAIPVRQSAAVSNKYIDGTNLAGQSKTTMRIAYQNNNQVDTNMNTTYPTRAKTKTITMDGLVSVNKKYSPQKKTEQYQAPVPSTHGPTATQTYGNENGNVSESMAAFLTAEKLANGSLAESEIERAMEEARQQSMTSTGQQAPSAISIEEQRLLQSLDRLNERLKVADVPYGQPAPGAFVPRPPAFNHGGFRGHTPISAHTRRNSAGSVPRHVYRAHSANYGAYK